MFERLGMNYYVYPGMKKKEHVHSNNQIICGDVKCILESPILQIFNSNHIVMFTHAVNNITVQIRNIPLLYFFFVCDIHTIILSFEKFCCSFINIKNVFISGLVCSDLFKSQNNILSWKRRTFGFLFCFSLGDTSWDNKAQVCFQIYDLKEEENTANLWNDVEVGGWSLLKNSKTKSFCEHRQECPHV